MAIEVCVDSVESAIIAEKCGADRLEVCMSLVTGGITPHMPFLRTIRAYVSLPIHVLVRPRYGDFLYNPYEVQQMCTYIQRLKASGLAQGIVIGALTAEGRLDINIMKRLMDSGQGLSVTCHRCFDMVVDQKQALEDLKQLNVECVLTSGGYSTALEGLEELKNLKSLAAGDIDIMPGAGISLENFSNIIEALKPKYIHLSAKEIIPSDMVYKNEHLSMGQSSLNEYSLIRTNESLLRSIVKLDKDLKG